MFLVGMFDPGDGMGDTLAICEVGNGARVQDQAFSP